jgi:hypothetical protein
VPARAETNWIRVAVDRLGGGTKAAVAVRVSGTAIHKWIGIGYVPRSDHAWRLAQASGVPIQKLVGPDRVS